MPKKSHKHKKTQNNPPLDRQKRLNSTTSSENEKSLVMTMTGEFHQPTRLYYEIFSLQEVSKVLNNLSCMDFNPEQNRWVWLYMAEAAKIKFAKKIKIDPNQPIVLVLFS